MFLVFSVYYSYKTIIYSAFSFKIRVNLAV